MGDTGRAASWRMVADDDWIRVRAQHQDIPSQGWKLHLSATVWSAEELLRRALPILLDRARVFKVAGSRAALAALNNGDAGLSQVGKFITVYPAHDAQAVELAVALDAATADLRGPRIPSDRRLGPDSCVWYRFGGFGDGHLQTAVGEILPALTDPRGNAVPDVRTAHYLTPEWAVDPFARAGLGTEAEPRRLLVGRRYLLGAMLHRAPRGAVYMAADLIDGHRCVLKQASPDALITADGQDARDRLRHEAEVLRVLRATDDGSPFPRMHGVVEDDDDVFLVLEDIVGVPLGVKVHQRYASGQPLTTGEVVEWGLRLTHLLGVIHDAGYVYRDLKSGNVLVEPENRLRLLDFELAHEAGTARRPYGRGTPGYMSPQQARGDPPQVADDVYALGAVLFLLLTGVEPSRAPDAENLLSRSIVDLNPCCEPALAALVKRCLAPDPEQRPASAAAVAEALRVVTSTRRRSQGQFLKEEMSVDTCVTPRSRGQVLGEEMSVDTDRHARWRNEARLIGDGLCDSAVSISGQPGLTWRSALPSGLRIPCRDINLGVAGTMLALAELVDAFGDTRHRRVLHAAARWLEAAPVPAGVHVPGLYVGESGVGAALLRAGQILEDQHLVDAAAARGHLVASLPFGAPDLFNGTAGRLRFHLLLFDATTDRVHLRAAHAAAESLIASARPFWVAPPGYDRLSERPFIGYAHGTAGIADALLDLFEVSGDERYRDAATEAGRWVVASAIPTLADGSGLDWPVCAGDAEGQGFWCHGAAGVARFLLHAAALDCLEGALDLAARAALTIVHATRWASSCQCHGLSGNIEVLLDLYQLTRQRQFLDQAFGLAALLDGSTSGPATSDFLGGSAGVAACLLRLLDPQKRPTLLGRAGFAFREPRDTPSN